MPAPEQPQMQMTCYPGVPPRYELVGWTEFDLWARRNIPTWQCITERCAIAGISDEVRLKMLCEALLGKTQYFLDLTLRYAMKHGFPPP
jgi:hypothetical protein